MRRLTVYGVCAGKLEGIATNWPSPNRSFGFSSPSTSKGDKKLPRLDIVTLWNYSTEFRLQKSGIAQRMQHWLSDAFQPVENTSSANDNALRHETTPMIYEGHVKTNSTRMLYLNFTLIDQI